MNNLNVKIEYIYNSGFTIETENHFLVFDYYKGDINLSNKKTTVFVSHSHSDHYNPEIFNFKGNIKYILSDDITDNINKDKDIYFVQPDSHLQVDDLDIKVFGSTDLGVSFLVSLDGLNIFHAGDLNWWYWENDSLEEKEDMERDFKKEISKITGSNIDIAFFPVDPRLENAYSMGGEFFIKELSPAYFIPMHFGDNFNTTSRFIHKMKDFSTHILEIKEINQQIIL